MTALGMLTEDPCVACGNDYTVSVPPLPEERDRAESEHGTPDVAVECRYCQQCTHRFVLRSYSVLT